jgi:hypothetical protein
LRSHVPSPWWVRISDSANVRSRDFSESTGGTGARQLAALQDAYGRLRSEQTPRTRVSKRFSSTVSQMTRGCFDRKRIPRSRALLSERNGV